MIRRCGCFVSARRPRRGRCRMRPVCWERLPRAGGPCRPVRHVRRVRGHLSPGAVGGVCPRVAGEGFLEPAFLEGGHGPVVPELRGGLMDGGRVLGAGNCTEWLLPHFGMRSSSLLAWGVGSGGCLLGRRKFGWCLSVAAALLFAGLGAAAGPGGGRRSCQDTPWLRSQPLHVVECVLAGVQRPTLWGHKSAPKGLFATQVGCSLGRYCLLGHCMRPLWL